VRVGQNAKTVLMIDKSLSDGKAMTVIIDPRAKGLNWQSNHQTPETLQNAVLLMIVQMSSYLGRLMKGETFPMHRKH
jgi:hypothetical protein